MSSTTMVLVGESAVSGVQLDTVAHELRADDVDFLADHVLGASQEICGCDLVFDPVAGAVEFPLTHAREVHDGLAQSLGWDCAGVDADAAEHHAAFDHSDGFAELGGRDGCLLPAGAGAD